MTAKLATLVDNFSVNDLSTVWPNSFGTVNWSTGQVAIKCDTSHDSAIQTNGPYDFTSSSMYLKIAPYIATSGQFSVQLMEPSNNNNKMHFGLNGSNFTFYKTISGTQTELGTVTYNATSMAWWRCREASGTTYIDTAPDASGSPGTWTNRFSTVDTTFNFPLTSVAIQMLGGDYGSDPAGTAYIYAVNESVYVPPSTGKVYMGGWDSGQTNTTASDWAIAQGLPNADGGFQSLYQWGNGWTGTNSVEQVQVATAEQMAGYPGPCCLNVAMCESDAETSLANSLSGSSLTSGCQAAHAATAVACINSGVQFIRMAWEFNGGQNYNWMPPFSSYTAAEFKELWQLIYNVYSAAAVNAGLSANWFKFIYCMVQNDSNGNADMSNYYPGMPYASYITIDEYDRSGGGYTGWAEAINDQPTLTESVTFALAQGAEGVGFPEWGIRDDAYGPSVIPDPAYINSAFSWAQGVTEQGLNVLMWPWGASYSGSISGIPASSWNFAAWPTMWSALTSNVATGISEGWIATTNPTLIDPRGAVWNRTDMVYGSQIGAWDENCSSVGGVPAALAAAQAADIRVIRWQMWQTPAALGGAQTTAEFQQGLTTIKNIGAIPLLGLPPIYNEQYPGGTDPWSYAWMQWMVQQAGPGIYEMGNEPDNYGSLTATEYYNTLWGSNVPALKAYARTLGFEIQVGGPAWANSYTANLSDLETFLSLCKAGYSANGNNLDYIPDFVSSHMYLRTPTDNDNITDMQTMVNEWGSVADSLRTYINTEFAGIYDRGYPVAKEIKYINSEWNWTIENSLTQNQTFMNAYITAMFTMMTTLAPDGSQRMWGSNQFTLASQGGGAMDMLQPNGSPNPEYNSYTAASTVVPRQ